MHLVRKDQTETFKNSEHCTAVEYPMDDKDINGAVIELTGRYPDKGRVVNLECKELAFVMKGTGKVVVEGKEILLNEGDLISIDPDEKYFFDGHMTMFVPCVPAWHPGQYREVE